MKDPAMLGQLIDLFDDQCPYPEIMYSLAQSIESYPSELYIQDLIKKLNDLVENTPYWAGFLFNRVFNSPKDFKIFEENIHLAPVKATIRLLDLMEI